VKQFKDNILEMTLKFQFMAYIFSKSEYYLDSLFKLIIPAVLTLCRIKWWGDKWRIVWLQASSEIQMRASVFWNVTQCRLVVIYW